MKNNKKSLFAIFLFNVKSYKGYRRLQFPLYLDSNMTTTRAGKKYL